MYYFLKKIELDTIKLEVHDVRCFIHNTHDVYLQWRYVMNLAVNEMFYNVNNSILQYACTLTLVNTQRKHIIL